MYAATKHLYSQWIKGTLTVLFISIAFTGCELPLKTTEPTVSASQQSTFDYATTREVTAIGTIRSGSGNVLPGVPFALYSEIPTSASQPFAHGVSDESGNLNATLNLPTAFDKIYLRTNYVGFPALYEIPIINNRANFEDARIVTIRPTLLNKSGTLASGAATYIPALKYLGTWKADGTPNYLEPARDVIDAALLARLNQSLPEYQSVVKTHPEYITPTDKSTILTEKADVWVTFIHEGAGYLNVLGFYTYPVGKPPTSITDIDSITIVFPNVSYSGSGGGLLSGDKVHIGQFGANTAIGWVAFANGFSGGKISTGNWMFFSNQSLNPESNILLRQHNVLLNDVGYNHTILGFEDIKRDAGSDQDFNDVMFSVTSNPVVAIAKEGLAVVDTPQDADGDGVRDAFDAYPNDPKRAFDSYTPGSGSYNTLVFEDLFPGRGDDDFNDLVVGYSSHQISNAKNDIVSLDMTFVLRSIGASNKLGFGFELPVLSNQVAAVKIDKNKFTTVPLNGNGTEAGQKNATVVLFDNAFSLMQRNGGAYVNTEQNVNYSQPETIRVAIDFASPISPSVLGTAPYNPFIFVNGRSREVHLPNKAPTVLADVKYFGTSSDNSKPGIGRYYVTKDNKPWVLNIVGGFDYPFEKSNIQSAYVNYLPWVVSNGNLYKDWYSTKSGNRDDSKIWKKK